jgi:hypothetical protein
MRGGELITEIRELKDCPSRIDRKMKNTRRERERDKEKENKRDFERRCRPLRTSSSTKIFTIPFFTTSPMGIDPTVIADFNLMVVVVVVGTL